MVEPKELRRVLAIARVHARDAMAKHDTQRESYLAYCRANWKRYAAGFTKSKGECERFAAQLDLATRDLIGLAEEAPDAETAAEILRGEQPPDWADTIEGAMDSVITYEAHQEPVFDPEPAEAAGADEAFEPMASEVTHIPTGPPVELGQQTPFADHLRAEEEDRLGARYGFRSPADEPPTPTVEAPEHAQELQRKVRAVLLAHRTKTGS
jgi:hypothetical protein